MEDPIKQAFSKVKEDIYYLNVQIEKIKQEITENFTKFDQILKKLEALDTTLNKLKEDVSMRNDGANQSINHLINQSITNQSSNHSNLDELPLNEVISQIKSKDKVNQSFNQSINHQSNNQSFNHLINQSQEKSLKGVTEEINKTFSSFSKQELKLFLTIYQLEDEALEVSYKAISTKMQLSEHCIRSHLSSLLRKNAPVIKTRLNNHTNLLSVSKEFRSLNLKQRLINLYYDSDPHQKTLFQID